jgi:hypothetical protein
MNPNALEALRSRIRRADSAARQPAARGYEQAHIFDDGTIHRYSISGIKSPDQLHDDPLNLFVWVWSLKDHLKEAYKANNLDRRLVEEVANQCSALQYVADIANRAKHRTLRESRSGEFAELVGVGFTVLKTAIAKIVVGTFSVGLEVAKPEEVELHAFIKTKNAKPIDAFTILNEAIDVWETRVIKRNAA